jgi:hypothetical protein
MDKAEKEFREAVSKSARNAIQEANESDVDGDPATHVTAKVDGRTAFVRDFKEFCEEQNHNRFKIGPVTLKNRDGYTIHISGLKGTNIQNHKKKHTLYRHFEQEMKDRGWNMSLELSQYAR